MNNLRRQFTDAIEANQQIFGVSISAKKVIELADYYEVVQKHNEILHLVAPCSPEEFAIRHILESLTLLEFLPKNARFADVGAGAGLPSIPCLIARSDLRCVLIESKLKKADFLRNVLNQNNLENRAEVFDRQFEEIIIPNLNYVVCRALDKFSEKLPKILKWSKNRKLLFFGGNNLSENLEKQNVKFKKKLMPLSEQRFLFTAQN